MTGTVISEETGEPLENVHVELEMQGLTALTDAAGRYSIVGAQPGTDTIQASYSQLTTSRREVDLTAPGTTVVDLALPGAAVRVADLIVEVESADQYALLNRRIVEGLGRLILRSQSALLLAGLHMTVRIPIRRSRGQRIIAGVCGGFADTLG